MENLEWKEFYMTKQELIEIFKEDLEAYALMSPDQDALDLIEKLVSILEKEKGDSD